MILAGSFGCERDSSTRVMYIEELTHIQNRTPTIYHSISLYGLKAGTGEEIPNIQDHPQNS